MSATFGAYSIEMDATIPLDLAGGSPRALGREVAHRPFPLPPGPWVAAERWEDVLFVHWPVPVPQLRQVVPAPLAIDVFDGLGWVGLVLRTASHLRVRGLPPIPFLRSPELVLRTYVRVGAHAGVYELVHHGSIFALLGARVLHRVPARVAPLRTRHRAGWIEHALRARDGTEIEIRHRPAGAAFRPLHGSIERFLMERYAVLSVEGDRIHEGGLHHRPWVLRHAEIEVERDTLSGAHGIAPPPAPRLVHHADRQDVLLWPARRAAWAPEVA